MKGTGFNSDLLKRHMMLKLCYNYIVESIQCRRKINTIRMNEAN